jgi:hypothetical protein
MTPYEIQLLIHCHTIAYPAHDWPCAETPLLHETLTHFKMNGLIDDQYKTTERGALHINTLCETPWPVQKWVVPERN